MASANKFNSFVGDLGLKKIDLNGDSFKISIGNTSPNAADTVMDTTATPPTIKSTSNAAEVAAGNGYTAGGTAIGSNAYSQTSGTGKMTGNAVTFTASGGTIGPFRYATVYDNTSGTTATRSVLFWWDYTASVTLNDGETFKVAADTSGNNWTSGAPLVSIT